MKSFFSIVAAVALFLFGGRGVWMQADLNKASSLPEVAIAITVSITCLLAAFIFACYAIKRMTPVPVPVPVPDSDSELTINTRQ